MIIGLVGLSLHVSTWIPELCVEYATVSSVVSSLGAFGSNRS